MRSPSILAFADFGSVHLRRRLAGDVGAARGRQARRRAEGQAALEEGPAADGGRGRHAPASCSVWSGRGSGPSWPTRRPTALATMLRACVQGEVGAGSHDAGAEAVAQADSGLGDRPGRCRVEVEDAGLDAVGDDVGDAGVDGLVDVGADLGQRRLPQAEQVELLPEPPVVGEQLVAGQAAVEEGREPLRRLGPGPLEGLLGERVGDRAGVAEHLGEELLLGVEVVVHQAGGDPGGLGDAGHPHVDQPVAHDAVGGGDEDPVAGLLGGQVATVGFLHAVPPIG